MAWKTTNIQNNHSEQKRHNYSGQNITGRVEQRRFGLMFRFIAHWRNRTTGIEGRKDTFGCLSSAQYWVEQQDRIQQPRSA